MPLEPSVRIVIADDHEIFRDGLKRLLEGVPGFSIAGEAADGVAALDVVKATLPDVLLLDVAMPRMGGLETLSAIPRGLTRIVLLTAGIDPADLLRAMQLGARGVVLKESATRLLIDGIRRVMNDKFLIGSGVVDDLAQAIQRASATQPSFGLSARELEVVAAVVSGESNRGVAERLRISTQTVKHHLTSIFDKTGTSSRLELAIFAIRHSLVEPDRV